MVKGITLENPVSVGDGTPTLSKKEYQKIYRDNHKEYFEEYRKKYYEEKREKVLKYVTESIQCECGFISARCNLLRHQKTKLHLKKLSMKL